MKLNQDPRGISNNLKKICVRIKAERERLASTPDAAPFVAIVIRHESGKLQAHITEDGREGAFSDGHLFTTIRPYLSRGDHPNNNWQVVGLVTCEKWGRDIYWRFAEINGLGSQKIANEAAELVMQQLFGK